MFPRRYRRPDAITEAFTPALHFGDVLVPEFARLPELRHLAEKELAATIKKTFMRGG